MYDGQNYDTHRSREYRFVHIRINIETAEIIRRVHACERSRATQIKAVKNGGGEEEKRKKNGKQNKRSADRW